MMFRMEIVSGRTLSVTVITVVVLGLAAGGCASSGADVVKASPPAPSTEDKATPSPEGSAVSDQPEAATTLRFGRPALMDFSYNDKKGKLQITVTRIVKGRTADLSGLSLSGKARKMVPYYIHATVKNAGTTDLSLTMPPGPRGVLANGDAARSLSVIGRFARCDSYPDTHKFPPGKSYRTCAPVLADPGDTVTGAEWSSDPYSDGPVATWTRRPQ
ncbi:hypothetical protein [Nonomuraea wenchangensis]|uniref:hypothetical protein n=2 Tax=Nonomuraea wenchangensis TaxID=568860 RepID=UPI00331F3FEA